MLFCNCTLQLQPAFNTHVSNAVHAGNPSWVRAPWLASRMTKRSMLPSILFLFFFLINFFSSFPLFPRRPVHRRPGIDSRSRRTRELRVSSRIRFLRPRTLLRQVLLVRGRRPYPEGLRQRLGLRQQRPREPEGELRLQPQRWLWPPHPVRYAGRHTAAPTAALTPPDIATA